MQSRLPGAAAEQACSTRNRTAGDLLLTFELLNGGDAPKLSMRRWLDSTSSGSCDSNPAKPCWSAPTVLTALTVPAAEGSFRVESDGNITFGEMAVDLGLTGIFTPGQCTSFASVYAKSRSSGSSINSQISDLVAPVTKTVTNCGSITVSKTVAGPTIAGDQSSFEFTVTCGPTVDLDPTTAGIQATKTFSLLHGQSLKVSNIPVGSNCTATETAPTPATHWTTTYTVNASTPPSTGLAASVNNVPLTPTQTVAFTNTRNSGAMAVSKTSTGGTGTFLFSVDCNDGTDHDRTGTNKISITTATAGTTVTSSAITGIPTGTICTVTEDTHTQFAPTTPTPPSGQVTIDADPTTTQTVSYTNVRKTATLTVDKVTSGGTGTFRFAVDCNDGTIHDRTGTDKLSITNTGTDTVAGIPTGTSCTVTEDTHPDFNSSLRSPSTTNTVSISDSGATVFFQNTRKTGTLTVSKSRTGGSATDVFTFEVDCTDNTFDRKGAQALSITGSGTATVTGIPTGTSCVVTETTDDRYASTPTPSNGTVIMDENGETVSFSNVRNTGTLTISKTTTGGSGTFTFTVDCSDDAFDTTRTITGTNSATVTGIPTGTTCTVTETIDPLFASTRSPLNGQRTIDIDGETVSFENVRRVGALKIEKTTAGGTGTFTFVVDCSDNRFDRTGLNGTTKVSITNSGSETIGQIPTGTTCSVTEDDNALFTSTVTSAGSSVTIAENTQTVSFRNVRKTGTLTVSKTTVGGSGTFRFEVDCTDNAFDRTGNARLTVVDSGSATLSGIPTGVSCTVTESDNPLFTSTTTSASNTVTIDVDGESVAFRNVRKTGSLIVSKTTSGGTGTFKFAVDCSDDSFDRGVGNELTIVTAGTARIDGIPTGTTCTVTENADPLFTSSLTSATATVTIDTDGETVSFNNVRKVGTLTVSKTTTGGTGTFLFAVDCSDDAFDRLGNKKLSITGSGTQTIENIPTGTTCTVTEDADPLFTSTRTPSNGLVTIDTDGESVTFTNARKTGTLTVTKTTSGGTGTFRFAVDCTDDRFDRLGADRLTIVGSGSATVTDIPTTVVCTVTETDDSLFTSTRTPSNGQVAMDADGETVAFTNVRNTGTLTVAKATTGGDSTFRFAVDCTDDRFDRSAVDVLTTLGSGSSAPITAIPTQTSCTVTETVPAGWAAVGATSKTVVIVGQETASFSNRKLPSGIAIAKVASAPTVHSGDNVTYTYTVTNIGENPLTSVVVVDDKCTPVVFGAGDIDGDKALDLTEAWTFTCVSSLTGTTTNIATATGTDPHGATPTANATATVTVIRPAIAVDKTPSATSVAPGTTVVYTYTVTNPGDVPLSAVTVSDDKCSPVTFVLGDLNVDKLLQVGETWVFQCSQVQTGSLDTLTNVGTATGVDTLGLKVTGTDTVSISVVAPTVIVRPAPEVVTAPAVIAAPATLPRTGSDAKGLLQLAGSLILLGLALVLTAGPISRVFRLRTT